MFAYTIIESRKQACNLMTGMQSKKEKQSMHNKKDNDFDSYIDSNINSSMLELGEIANNIQEEHTAELRAYIQQHFTPLEIETMKYIAQGFTAEKIAQIQNVEKSTIDRRKEYIIQKATKYCPADMIINKKQVLTIKNIVYNYKLYDDNDTCSIISEREFETEKERLRIKFLNDFFN